MMIDHSVIEKEAAFGEEMKRRALAAEQKLDELRRQLEERTEMLAVARTNTFQAEQDARVAEAKRDEAQALLEVVRGKYPAWVEQLREQASHVPGLTAELDLVTHERDELRKAARAFLEAFANQAARCILCEEEGKREPVMLREGLRMACDAHGRELLEAPNDLSYAPALRALRARLAE